MIKLYGIPASRASRCLWMLEELGVKYENVPTHFIGDVKKPDYLKLNPNGHIPTLDDEGLVLWESLAINLHLARKYGKGSLWPESRTISRAPSSGIWAMTRRSRR
jgi:glutathione S-transferase